MKYKKSKLFDKKLKNPPELAVIVRILGLVLLYNKGIHLKEDKIMLNFCIFVFTLYALGSIASMLFKRPYTKGRGSKKR